MRTGEVVANIAVLNEHFRLPEIDELVTRKREGTEKMALSEAEVRRYDAHLERLEADLQAAHATSTLPNEPSTADALDDFVVRLRLDRCAET